MNKRKLQGLINRIEDDVNALKYLLKSKYKKREEVDVDVIIETNFNEVVHVDVYHIDLEIERINANIEAYEDVIKKVEMLKESIED